MRSPGSQTLLSELWPSQDQVGMMVFPGLQSGTAGWQTSAANDVPVAVDRSTCNMRNSCSIEITGYSDSPIYQLVAPTAGYCSVSTGSCGASTSLSTSSACCLGQLSIGYDDRRNVLRDLPRWAVQVTRSKVAKARTTPVRSTPPRPRSSPPIIRAFAKI